MTIFLRSIIWSHDLYKAFHLLPVASGGGGERWNVSPHPETGKIVVPVWCSLPEVYTFGEESEIQEILSKNVKKVNFYRDFAQKILKNFLEIFQNFLRFFLNAQNFAHLIFLPDGNHSSIVDDLSFFYKFQSIFYKNFKNFHPISNSPPSEPFLSLF